MPNITSSIPGLVSLPFRNDMIKSGKSFLYGRQQVDGAEGLWRIRNSLYDLQHFVNDHPGGAEWISLTKGTDITEIFESHHISNRANLLLPKFYVREAKTPRPVPITFADDGFYNKFKKRARVALSKVDYHNPSMKSNLISDSLALMTFISCLLAVKTESWLMILIAAVGLSWTAITAHNYFHMRNNFRMYYFDISLASSKEWRITHVMSHHMYPNTIWDFEIYIFEPILNYLPMSKTRALHVFSIIISPVIWFLSFYIQGIKRYISILLGSETLEFRDIVPFIIPISMSIVSMNILMGFTTWLKIIGISSIVFYFIGLNAAHHHPNIFHDGDIYRENLDWGLLEMDAVRGRKVVDDSLFLTLTNFGSHDLHHLLPTVDHNYLSLCLPAFEETCREFNIDCERYSQLELVIGQFRQLGRCEPKRNSR